jgi:hypothetical protein
MVLRGRSSTMKTCLGSLNLARRCSSALAIEAAVIVGAGLDHHDRGDALAEIGMRAADDGALDHARHLVDLGLDLLGIDVVAAGDDQVLAAPDDVDVALGSILPRSPVMKKPSARNSALVFSGLRQ